MSRVAYAMSDTDLLTLPASDPSESTWERQPREDALEWRILAKGSNEEVELTLTQAPPSWSSAALSDLLQLMELPENWNSYRAHRIDSDAVKCAIEVLFGIVDRNTPRPAIVPTARGGVQIEWHGKIDVEIEVAPNGAIAFLSGDLETNFASFTKAIPAIRRELQTIYR